MKKQILLLVFSGASLPLNGMNQEETSFNCIKKGFVAAVVATVLLHFGLQALQPDSTPAMPEQVKLTTTDKFYERTVECKQHPEYQITVECREAALKDANGNDLGKVCNVKGVAVTRSVTGIIYHPEHGIGVPYFNPADEIRFAEECYVEALQEEHEFTYIKGLTDYMKHLLSKVKGVQHLPDDAALILPSKKQ